MQRGTGLPVTVHRPPCEQKGYRRAWHRGVTCSVPRRCCDLHCHCSRGSVQDRTELGVARMDC